MDLDLLHQRLLGSLLRLGGGHGEELVLGSNVVNLGQLFGVLLSLLLLSSKLSLERGVRLLRALDGALDHALDVLARAVEPRAALRLKLDPRVRRLLSQRRDFSLRLFQSHQEDHVVRGELGDALFVPRRGRLRLLRAFQSLREVGPGVVSLLQPSLVPVDVASLLFQNFNPRERRLQSRFGLPRGHLRHLLLPRRLAQTVRGLLRVPGGGRELLRHRPRGRLRPVQRGGERGGVPSEFVETGGEAVERRARLAEFEGRATGVLAPGGARHAGRGGTPDGGPGAEARGSPVGIRLDHGSRAFVQRDADALARAGDLVPERGDRVGLRGGGWGVAGHHLGLDHLGGLATSLAFGAFGGSALPHGSSPLLAPALVVRLLGGRGARGGGADGAGERRGMHASRDALDRGGARGRRRGSRPGRDRRSRAGRCASGPAGGGHRARGRAAPFDLAFGHVRGHGLLRRPFHHRDFGSREPAAVGRAWMWRAPEGAPRRRG